MHTQFVVKPDGAGATCLCLPQRTSNRSTLLGKTRWTMTTSHVKVRGRMCDADGAFPNSRIPDLNAGGNPSIIKVKVFMGSPMEGLVGG